MRRRKDELDAAQVRLISILAMDPFRCRTLRKNGGDAFMMIPDPAWRVSLMYGIKYHGVYILDRKGIVRWSLVADGSPERQRPDADFLIAEIKKIAK